MRLNWLRLAQFFKKNVKCSLAAKYDDDYFPPELFRIKL